MLSVGNLSISLILGMSRGIDTFLIDLQWLVFCQMTECMRRGHFEHNLLNLLNYWTGNSGQRKRAQVSAKGPFHSFFFKRNIQNQTRLNVPPFQFFSSLFFKNFLSQSSKGSPFNFATEWILKK